MVAVDSARVRRSLAAQAACSYDRGGSLAPQVQQNVRRDESFMDPPGNLNDSTPGERPQFLTKV